MKNYIAPKIVVIEIDANEVIANSGETIGIDPNHPIGSDDLSARRRVSDWDAYER